MPTHTFVTQISNVETLSAAVDLAEAKALRFFGGEAIGKLITEVDATSSGNWWLASARVRVTYKEDECETTKKPVLQRDPTPRKQISESGPYNL
jgi:hypothetical protein